MFHGPRHGFGGPHYGPPPPPALTPVFDLTFCHQFFTVPAPALQNADEGDSKTAATSTATTVAALSPEETLLTELLLRRNSDLMPTAQEQQLATAHYTRVTTCIERIQLAPQTFDAAQIEDAKPVGSYKKGTMLTRHNVSDLVIVLRTLPTKEAVAALAKRVIDDIRLAEPREVLSIRVTEFGFEIAQNAAILRVHVTTHPSNFKLCNTDLHLDVKWLRIAFQAIGHARWFEENANSTVRVLVRLLKDMRSRFEGLRAMNPWMIELLSHYAVCNTQSRESLQLAAAFRRVLQLLAAGIFLPGSTSIVDPVEFGPKGTPLRVHTLMTLEEQDETCFTAQTLLRILLHGGARTLLGYEGNAQVSNEMSIWNGVVVMPSERVFEKESTDSEAVPAAPASSAAAH